MEGEDGMSAPKRIQRLRTKGWTMPDGAVYVGRPTRWGNPFTVERVPNWPRWAGAVPWRVMADGREWDWPEGDPRTPVVYESRAHGNDYLKRKATALAVHLFEIHTGPMGSYEYDAETLADLRADLAGRDLACWCPLDQPCHADVLLEIANREQP